MIEKLSQPPKIRVVKQKKMQIVFYSCERKKEKVDAFMKQEIKEQQVVDN